MTGTLEEVTTEELTAVTVEVTNPESPFGGVQIFGVSDAPIQIVLREGAQGEPGAPGPPGPSGPSGPDAITSGVTITQLVMGQSFIHIDFPSALPDASWTLVSCCIVNTTDPDPLNILPGIITFKAATGFTLQLTGLPDTPNYFLNWVISGVSTGPDLPVTVYLFSGPSGGDSGVASTPFTVELPVGGTLASPVTITPDDGGAGGAFTPASVSLDTGTPSATFTYTPASAGAKTISVTNSGGLINPANLTYTATVPAIADGDPVSTWPDSSGNGHDATQTGSARPIYKTAILNGKPVVRFATASSTSMIISPTISANVPWTIFTVLIPLSTATSMGGLFSDGANTSPFGCNCASDGNFYVANRTNFGYTSPYTTAAKVVATFSNGTGTPIAYVNGSGPISLTNIAVAGTGDFASLCAPVQSGDLAEVILYNSELSTVTDYLHVNEYLCAKYGITNATPSTPADPASVSGLVAWWKADAL